ncbi:FMRFamide receptor-like [Plakobranchus ocellatus]|uniref:FMRFamide receptor-like n=1 Tax=Plakobranchus ocellatus TaxID=259542 RepID=A0AAV3ZPG4_9GAST|nr:FMRFamide receptor-like [Plakobranchus ocellatus]
MLSYESAGYVIILPAVCLFGIAGNILNLVVLIKDKIQGTAYSYLKALAILDLLSLAFILPIITRCSTCILRDSHFGPFFEAYIHVFIGDVFIKSSIWTVVVFTAERCITSCFPTSALSLLVQKRIWGGATVGVRGSLGNQRQSAVTNVLLIVLVLAIENSPTFWKYEIQNNVVVRGADFEQNVFFRFYDWFDALFSCLIPSLTLIILNIILITFLRKRGENAQTSESTAATQTSGLHPHSYVPGNTGPAVVRRSRGEQTRILVTLVGIVILSLSTILPTFIIQLIGQYSTFAACNFFNLRVTNSILLAVNCSGNFVLYCMLNRRFWASFKKVFGLYNCSHPQHTTRIIVTRILPIQQPALPPSTASSAP